AHRDQGIEEAQDDAIDAKLQKIDRIDLHGSLRALLGGQSGGKGDCPRKRRPLTNLTRQGGAPLQIAQAGSCPARRGKIPTGPPAAHLFWIGARGGGAPTTTEDVAFGGAGPALGSALVPMGISHSR